MSETLVKNTINQNNRLFDNFKTSLSDNSKVDSVSSKTTSFDDFFAEKFSDDKIQKTKEFYQSQKKSTNPNQKSNNQNTNNNTHSNNNVSEPENNSQTTNTNETSTETEDTETQSTEETHHADKDTEETLNDNPIMEQQFSDLLQMPQELSDDTISNLSDFLIALNETLTPIPQINITETQNITGLDTQINDANLLLNDIDLNNTTIQTNPINNMPISLEQQNTLELNLGTAEDITKTEQLETEFSLDLDEDSLENTNITNTEKPTELLKDTLTNLKLETTALSENNPLTSSDKAIEGLSQFTTTHTHNAIHRQSLDKTSQIEIVAQIPLKNDMSVSIIKDADNPNKIGINLEPAGMGDVELVIENNKDNAIIAVIRSDKPEILDQLRKESASLERYLTEAGLNLGGSGLGFEQKSHDNQRQQENINNTILNASITEKIIDNYNPKTTIEQIYALLDKQSSQSGLDIRL